MKLLATADRFALEAALALRGDGDEVLVLAVGEEQAERGLRHALAMGADRAVRVWDEGLASLQAAGQDADIDELALAKVLAAVAHTERPRLILCQAQSPDLADDITGIALAGMLDRVHVHDVLAVERDGERLTVRRQSTGNREQLLRVAMPALLAIRTYSNTPRQPNLHAFKRAREQPIAVVSLDELGLDAEAVRRGAGARVLAPHERQLAAPAPVVIEGSAAQIAARIADLARERIASCTAELERVELRLTSDARIEHLEYRDRARKTELREADFVVAIGRGLASEGTRGVARMQRLADRLGATLAVSGALVEAGLASGVRKVGISGRRVAPSVYLALGISGAVQHLGGMSRSRTIIAVNSDPAARIFDVAHYGAVANLHEVIDELERRPAGAD
jgi:electron transfer flavoprotein beta subunit